jgi:hypothetical protein
MKNTTKTQQTVKLTTKPTSKTERTKIWHKIRDSFMSPTGRIKVVGVNPDGVKCIFRTDSEEGVGLIVMFWRWLGWLEITVTEPKKQGVPQVWHT